MSTLEITLLNARKRYVEARAKGDATGMSLWLKVGLATKDRIAERLDLQTKEPDLEKIFDGKLVS